MKSIEKQIKMKKNYELKGMSCGGCENNVKRVLLQHADITEAEVKYPSQNVIITMYKNIRLDELQFQLNKIGSYRINEVV